MREYVLKYMASAPTPQGLLVAAFGGSQARAASRSAPPPRCPQRRPVTSSTCARTRRDGLHFLALEANGPCSPVLLEVLRPAGAGDWEHDGRAGEQPREADLRGSCVVTLRRRREDGARLRVGPDAEREERHE